MKSIRTLCAVTALMCGAAIAASTPASAEHWHGGYGYYNDYDYHHWHGYPQEQVVIVPAQPGHRAAGTADNHGSAARQTV